jgi:hypothetical protein
VLARKILRGFIRNLVSWGMGGKGGDLGVSVEQLDHCSCVRDMHHRSMWSSGEPASSVRGGRYEGMGGGGYVLVFVYGFVWRGVN